MSLKQCFEVSKLQNLEGNRDEEEKIETFHATPNMSILCQKCSNYIVLSQLQSHRSFHGALSLFKFDFQTRPTNEKALCRQRIVLVKSLNKMLDASRSAYRKELAKIDLAYEILKAEMQGRLNKVQAVHSSDHIEITLKSFMTELRDGVSLGVCQSPNEKWRSVMEDTYSCEPGTSFDFFSVYDGYNGQTAARKCAGQLHAILNENLTKFDTLEKFCESDNCQLSTCLQQTYDEMDKLLLQGDDETSRNRWSGCSATTCLLRGQHLHVANVGNVKAILLKGDRSVRTITEDHTPLNKKEHRRIKWNGDVQKLSKTVLVNGIATTTRGLGNHGDPIFKLNVISVPAVCCISLDADDQIILLGSSGFWEVFNEEEVAVLVQDWFVKKENEKINGKAHEENSSSENLIRINVVDEVEVPSEQTVPLSNTLSNNSQAGVQKMYDDRKECNDIAGSACGKDCVDYNNESVETNYLLKERSSHSSDKLYHNTKMQATDGTRNLSIGFLKYITSQHECCKVCLKLSKDLVKAALNGGARDNITVLTVLLNRK